MNTKWTLNEKSTGELAVTVETSVWESAQQKAFEKLAKNVEIKGFRKGAAPKELIRKQLSEGSIFNEAIDAIANDLFQQALKQENLEPINRASLDIKSLSKDELTLSFTFSIKPEVVLGEYKSIKIAQEPVLVTDDDVALEIKKLQENYAELVLKEGVAALGDTVVIDFEGFKDDVAFEGGKGENYPLELGSNSFIPGFEDALVGVAVNQELDVHVTFPAEYGVAELAGAPAIFKVKVHEIKTKQLPEITDEFVKELQRENVETVAQLQEVVLADLQHQKEHDAEHAFEEKLLEQVVGACTVDIPDSMIEDEVEVMFTDFKDRLQQQNYTIELYTSLTGQDEAYLKNQMKVDAEKKVKLRLVMEAIALKEGFDATEAEIDQEYETVAKNYGIEVDRVKEVIHKEVMLKEWRLRKAFEFIKESASA